MHWIVSRSKITNCNGRLNIKPMIFFELELVEPYEHYAEDGTLELVTSPPTLQPCHLLHLSFLKDKNLFKTLQSFLCVVGDFYGYILNVRLLSTVVSLS